MTDDDTENTYRTDETTEDEYEAPAATIPLKPKSRLVHMNLDNLDYYHFYILTLFAVLAVVCFLYNESMDDGKDPDSILDSFQATIMILLLLHFM